MKSHTLKSLISLSALLCAFVSSFADPDSFTVSVSGGNVFTISRSDASAASWVEYYTQSGSAVAGIHYEDVAGRLEFAKGESSKIVTVPLYSVASIDKYNLSGTSRQFYFCIHNNSMASTPRSTGSWNDATIISASDISTTRQQKITDDVVLSGSNMSQPYSREYMCNSVIGDAFSGDTKDYYTLSDQTLSLDFNVQLTYDISSDNYSVLQGVGVTLDGYSSEIAPVKTTSNARFPYTWGETNIPSGLQQNLCNNTFENSWGQGGTKTCTFPNSSSKKNTNYQTHYSNGWFVDMDPTKHVGFIITTQHAKLSNIVANVRVKDDFAPVITGISANVNRIYTSGERLYVAVHFNEPVTGNVSGASVSISSRSFTFNYACGLNTNTLVFYSDLTTTATSGITGTVKVTGINGTVTDACGNAASVSSISANNSVPNFRM